MRIRVLGSAAGGGSPQWNCGCSTCRAVRDGAPGTRPRTQSSIALRGTAGGWYLVNASPDLRQQIEQLDHAMRTSGRDGDGDGDALRTTPFAGVVLTDAEIDHAAGLLLLRESTQPLRVACTAEVHHTLTNDYPVLRMLDDWCGVDWHELVPGTPTTLPGTSLHVEPFVSGEDPPRYRRGDAVGPGASVGLVVADADARDAGTLLYSPTVETWSDELHARCAAARIAMLDGTFWSNDELVAQGIGTRDATAMGHLPVGDDGGLLEHVEQLDTHVVLVHLNNSNPVLVETSAERARLDAAGVAVAWDGMELELA